MPGVMTQWTVVQILCVCQDAICHLSCNSQSDGKLVFPYTNKPYHKKTNAYRNPIQTLLTFNILICNQRHVSGEPCTESVGPRNIMNAEVTCFVSESSRVSSICFPHGLHCSPLLLGLGRKGAGPPCRSPHVGGGGGVRGHMKTLWTHGS